MRYLLMLMIAACGGSSVQAVDSDLEPMLGDCDPCPGFKTTDERRGQEVWRYCYAVPGCSMVFNYTAASASIAECQRITALWMLELPGQADWRACLHHDAPPNPVIGTD